jgi:hypothetical protein
LGFVGTRIGAAVVGAGGMVAAAFLASLRHFPPTPPRRSAAPSWLPVAAAGVVTVGCWVALAFSYGCRPDYPYLDCAVDPRFPMRAAIIAASCLAAVWIAIAYVRGARTNTATTSAAAL